MPCLAATENNFRITGRPRIGRAIQSRGERDLPRNAVILSHNPSPAQQRPAVEPRYIKYSAAK